MGIKNAKFTALRHGNVGHVAQLQVVCPSDTRATLADGKNANSSIYDCSFSALTFGARAPLR